MDENNENKNQDFGYFIGRAFGFVLSACLAAITIAVTIRIVNWIL